MDRIFSNPVYHELRRHVVKQDLPLGNIVATLSELISGSSPDVILLKKHKKLSEVTDMIHSGYKFHRCVRDSYSKCDQSGTMPNDSKLHRYNVMSLLIGDYLLTQSSMDLASLRNSKTVGLMAVSLESYARGEFLTTQFNSSSAILNGLERYAQLTCGSLLSNACLSAAVLAGHDIRSIIGDLVYNFGFHAGSAFRLMEIVTDTDPDRLILEDFSGAKQSIKSHIGKSIEIISKIPGDTKSLKDIVNKLKV